MTKVKIVDPAGGKRNGWRNVYGTAEDALNGNVSRVFLTGVPMSVTTTFCYQPDDWSCGPYSLAECLGQPSGEDARNWLLARGLITSQYGTEYSGIVGYLNACGYSCEYDGTAHDGEMDSAIFDKIVNHMKKGYKVNLCMHGTRKGCRTNYWTYGGHYVCAYDIEGGGGGSTIKEDGMWGCECTLKAQQVFGTHPDKVISNQFSGMKKHLPNCMPASWKFVPQSKLTTGSDLVKAIQKKLGIKADGWFGMETILAFQKWLGVSQDGYVGGITVTAFQNWLNTQ